MAYTHSKNSSLLVDDSGGTARIIGGVDSVQFSQNADPVETTGIGDASKSYINGFVDTSISISGSWEYAAADATASDLVLSGILGGSAVTLDYRPNSSADQANEVDDVSVRYITEAICTSYDVNSGTGDKVNFSAEFLVTRSTGVDRQVYTASAWPAYTP